MRNKRLVIWAVSFLSAVFVLTFVASIVLTEGALRPLIRRRASDTTALAYSISQTAHVNATPVRIRAADGATMTGWWLSQQSGNSRAVMICHGVADSAFGGMGYALLFLRHGYSVLVPNARGHGDSQGFVTYGVLEADDTLKWLDWMKQQGVQETFGFGESLGASVLLESLCRHASFQAIVAECPYSSFQAVADERVAQRVGQPLAFLSVGEGMLYTRLRYGLDLSKARPDLCVKDTHIPILLIHGLQDNETSPENSKRLERENPRDIQLWLVPGAKHTGAYATQPHEFERRVLAWFANE